MTYEDDVYNIDKAKENVWEQIKERIKKVRIVRVLICLVLYT